MKAAGYIRVSTDEQAQDGVSLDVQEAKICSYCEYKGLELVEILTDAGISGSKSRAREGFQTILDRVESNGIQAVVIFSLDRLSRDMLTLLTLERFLNEYDIELHTIEGQVDTSSPDGFMNFAMKAFLGEMERRQVKDRTKRAMQHKKENGEVIGRVPYGFDRADDKLMPNAEEQTIRKFANDLYQQGIKVADIARRMNDAGYQTRTHSLWTSEQAKRLLDGYRSSYKRHSRIGAAIKDFILTIG